MTASTYLPFSSSQKIGMMVVILFYNVSIEVRRFYIEWKHHRQSENVDILLFIAVLNCRCCRMQPICSMLETTSVIWEEEEGQDFALLGAFIYFPALLVSLQLTLLLNSTYFFKGLDYTVLSSNLQSTLSITGSSIGLVLFFFFLFPFKQQFEILLLCLTTFYYEEGNNFHPL